MTEKFDPKAKGFKGIDWIPVKNLSVVWTQAQRPLDEKHAQAISENFDPQMFGTLAVTKPNGRGIYHLIDGHHRKVAVEKLWGDEEKVPCQIFDAEDPARAAKLFDHINSARKKPHPVDLFMVRVTAGNEIEVAVNKVVKSCGYNIGNKDGRAPNSNRITCVQALVSVHQSHGAEVLKNTLDLINAVWGLDTSSVTGVIVRGFAEFLSEFRDVDFKRLRDVLASKFTPARLHGAAKVTQEYQGGSLASAVKHQLFMTYNEGIRSDKKKLKPKER